MERLERLVIHVEEALRLARYEDESHLRLALMLLDSAAELILHRAVQTKLSYHHLEARLLDSYDQAEKNGPTLDEETKQHQAKLRTKVLSKSQLRDLDRSFDAKAEYLTRLGDLPLAQTRVLRKLHAYRNEAYHRDTVRSGSLRSAVNIYAYLACTMMRDLNVTGIAISLSVPEGLKPYLGGDIWAGGFDAPKKIAEALLASSGMDKQEELGIALGNHLEDRLQALLEGLDYIVDIISDGPSHEKWDAETALVLVQVAHEDGAFLTPDEARAMTMPFAFDDLGALRLRAQALAHATEPVTAFAEFADVEDAFEAIEVQVHKAVNAIDHDPGADRRGAREVVASPFVPLRPIPSKGTTTVRYDPPAASRPLVTKAGPGDRCTPPLVDWGEAQSRCQLVDCVSLSVICSGA